MVWKGDGSGRLAKSLIALVDDVDAKWPGRDRSSDGSIGNLEHQARASDHNLNAAGVVTALDLDRDIAAGFSARNLAEALVASRDPRIKYIISNGQIISSKVSPWAWRPYSGANAHREHIHISVIDDPALYDDTRPWATATNIAPPEAIQRTPADVRQRMGLATTKSEQRVDAQGRLIVYALPAGDGGGAYEVAGINVRWHPAAAAELKRMIESGVPDAEVRAYVGNYLGAYTDVADQWTVSWGIESYLRDCVFHRGPTGAAIIMQLALKALGEDLGKTGNLGDGVDGKVGTLTADAVRRQERDPLRFLEALRAAREVYERFGYQYIDGGPHRDESSEFWRGLINRFNNALTVARRFHAEQPRESQPVTDPQPLPSPPNTATPYNANLEDCVIELAKAQRPILERYLKSSPSMTDEEKRRLLIIQLGGTPPPSAQVLLPPPGTGSAPPAAPVPVPAAPTNTVDAGATAIGGIGALAGAAGALTGLAPLWGDGASTIMQAVTTISGILGIVGAAGGVSPTFSVLGKLASGLLGAFSSKPPTK